MNAPNDNTAPQGLRGWWLTLGALNLAGASWYLTIAHSAPART